jgi:hypothetical protein
MAYDQEPLVAQWYRHLDKGQRFQVTAVDQEGGTVEIQNFDGDVEEVDLDSWYELEIETIETPEDWTGPMDDVEHDDLGYSETDMNERDWTEPGGEEGEPAEPEEE